VNQVRTSAYGCERVGARGDLPGDSNSLRKNFWDISFILVFGPCIIHDEQPLIDIKPSQLEKPYKPNHKIRIVTAASLFDGHDVSINIMRRILQASGAEVIHLGHNRSVEEIVECALQEDVQAIAITSYQGGHIEFFKYMFDLLNQRNAGDIKIFAGGGGTILPDEIRELEAYGISRIYTPDDGRKMGLQGMINDLLQKSDCSPEFSSNDLTKVHTGDFRILARLITAIENGRLKKDNSFNQFREYAARKKIPVLGITGTGGAGKSSVADELIRRFRSGYPGKKFAIISIDPSKRKSGGALLGDRIRMNAIHDSRIFMRSMATRQANLALSKNLDQVLDLLKSAGFDLILLETSGIGQSDSEIIDHADLSLYVMTPEYGAPTQLEKIDMLDFADIVVLNKFDKTGAMDALRDIRKQYRRNHHLWELPDEEIPVIGTIASLYSDEGMNHLFNAVTGLLQHDQKFILKDPVPVMIRTSQKHHIVPQDRNRYLSEIAGVIREYDAWVEYERETAQQLYAIRKTIEAISNREENNPELIGLLEKEEKIIRQKLDPANLRLIREWDATSKKYRQKEFLYRVRDNQIRTGTYHQTISNLKIPKVSLPRYQAWGDQLRWLLQENVPGEFPFTAGVFPFKRKTEHPTRMFAGEGSPERTNRRFHYLSRDQSAVRLSTAFDSVTLYGEDPDRRPDILGKIGNSGVSICCLDDIKKLYSGFDLTDPSTSVSMTINGPASILTAFFLNAAIDQQCEKYIRQHGLEEEVSRKINDKYRKTGTPVPVYHGNLPENHQGLGLMLLGVSGDEVLPPEVYYKIREKTISVVRGTVQADILKEDQAQNTCIFSTEFALRLMGDLQQYFVNNRVRNFYSVSISGYHMAEAGANPITQLAFTLANGFTYLEYYRSRGMKIDDFAPNFSFFFSNGIDAEYAVIGRVARKIWAKALKLKYGANERSQKLKYHIQTSGRSLHAQEIDFNDIRTTLQALYAIYDNCNSLHTNAFDEAITTPTENSVRRAMAIQLIINQELGLTKNENPLQGSSIIEELTELVEEAVLMEFDRLTERGGVLGAMETMYQRGKIQEESMHYESLKHSGAYPVIGVNTFLSSNGSPTIIPGEVTRATTGEKDQQIRNVEALKKLNAEEADIYLEKLKTACLELENTFSVLMETVKYCTLGQITHALYEVGGKYRRNM
jgi:isobutyryl-CoA mutase